MSTSKEILTRFETLLKDRGLKFTYERKTIFEEVCHLKSHFDADSLYERFKNKGLRISRDTVYRTMPLLLESGVVQKSVGRGHRDFYEHTSGKGHHDHIVCVRCGKVIEFHCEEIEKLQEQICRDYDFQLVFHDHRLFGVCRACRNPVVPARSRKPEVSVFAGKRPKKAGA